MIPMRNKINGWLTEYSKNDFLRKLTTVLGLDMLAKASGFILIPIYLRLMSQEEYGSYNFMVSIVQTLGLLLTLGLYIPQSKLYYSLGSKDQRGRLLFTIAITLFLFVCIAVLPVFLLGGDFLITRKLFKNNFFYDRYRYVLLMALLVTMAGYILTYFLFTIEKIRQIRAYNIWRMIFVCLTVVAMAIFRKDPVKTRLMFTFGSELLLIIVFSSYYVKEMVAGFCRKLLVKCLMLGIPIMLTALFGMVTNLSDKFFLEKYGTLKDLSSYYLAFSFASVIPLISASLQNVWMPQFMKEKDLKRNSDKTKKLISKLSLAFVVISGMIWFLFLVLIRTELIPDKYQQGIYILPLLLISQVFMAITNLLNNYLIYFEKTYLLLLTGFIASGASVGLSLLLIPKWGIHGAAQTILASNLLYLLVSYYFVSVNKRRFMQRTTHAEGKMLDQVA
jgi:O-antigen/teichoic acid export membrane protein